MCLLQRSRQYFCPLTMFSGSSHRSVKNLKDRQVLTLLYPLYPLWQPPLDEILLAKISRPYPQVSLLDTPLEVKKTLFAISSVSNWRSQQYHVLAFSTLQTVISIWNLDILTKLVPSCTVRGIYQAFLAEVYIEINLNCSSFTLANFLLVPWHLLVPTSFKHHSIQSKTLQLP